MVKQNQSTMALLPLFLILSISAEMEGAKKSYGVNSSDNNSVKLFVFGDSYVDTGNFRNSGAYKPPSGMTFPGYPAGRFGNGLVLTDYLASYLKIETPTAYALKNSSNLQNGINFAYGGTGILKTLVDGPNLNVQIDSFEQLIKQNTYSKSDVQSSIVLVNAGANDYTKFVLKDRNLFEIVKFRKSLIDELKVNIRQNSALMNPLEPCCALESVGYDCGKVDEKGQKKYTLCEKPELSFFWDNAHPSQNGWNSVFKQLEPSLSQITGK
ncbi:hypothetical protein TanjilG_09626 [Lupinus angustifolius]|uniref:SGNH hydrolase-type esterase domain-containing protein n=1 Tax=Lupinus angustifolius TaxID=3871 RepID=A0A394DAE6_LUPAN|nr:hypothetical protein TanjilG_09626 [Lupinus angustifolius]